MSRNDAELLAATAAGDADAFGYFYRRHEALVVAYAVHRCANASDVADLVGDTFIGALRSASRFAQRDGDAVAWLLTIARRAMAHQRRSFLRRQRLGRRLASLPTFSADEADAVEAALDAARLAPELSLAISTLAPKDQELLMLVHRDGLTPTQAGRVVGMNPNTARVRLSRARARLRERLGDVYDRPTTNTNTNPEVSHVQP
jgi:RNA polymerase sigma factor (sigma-70 family)